MTEALKEIIRITFDELNLNRIEATYYVGNEKSGKVMRKCGMGYEGIARKEVKIKGNYMDVVHYGLLKEDWKNLNN
jgi:[ribosomal protein S5]-alanine N-acetyltransferase